MSTAEISQPVPVRRARRAAARLIPTGIYGWIAGRLLLCVFTLVVVSLLIFAATTILPGDAARAILGRNVRPEALATLREQLGLDRPVTAQYFSWVKGVFTGDLGESLTARQPVGSLAVPAAVNTFTLMFITLVISVPLSILIGCVSAVRRDRAFDRVTQVTSLILAAVPEFIIGMVLVIVFATTAFQVFPAVTIIPADERAYGNLDQMVLPIATLVLMTIPYLALTVRASVIEALESEYVVMARTKGLSERRVVLRHALPNTLAPAFQAIALTIAWLAGGLVIIEFLFNFPGLGGALQNAVTTRDLPMIQVITLILATVVVLSNLLADVLTVLVTPRLRTGRRR